MILYYLPHKLQQQVANEYYEQKLKAQYTKYHKPDNWYTYPRNPTILVFVLLPTDSLDANTLGPTTIAYVKHEIAAANTSASNIAVPKSMWRYLRLDFSSIEGKKRMTEKRKVLRPIRREKTMAAAAPRRRDTERTR
jgi:hypothetical protein